MLIARFLRREEKGKINNKTIKQAPEAFIVRDLRHFLFPSSFFFYSVHVLEDQSLGLLRKGTYPVALFMIHRLGQ